MKTLFVASERISQLLLVISKLLLALIVVLVAADVVARNLARSLVWSVSFTEYLMIYMAFLPMPGLVRGKGHVCADFIRTSLPRAVRRIVERVVYVLCIAICLYLGWVGFESLLTSLRSGAYDVRTFDMPRWLIYLPMVIGMGLSAIEFLRYLVGSDSIYAVDVIEMEGF